MSQTVEFNSFHAPRPVAPRPSPLKSSNGVATTSLSASKQSNIPFTFRASTGSIKRSLPTCLHRLRNSQDVTLHAEEELESILYSASRPSSNHSALFCSPPAAMSLVGRPQTPSPTNERKLGLELLPGQADDRADSSAHQHWRSHRNNNGATADSSYSNSLSSPLFHVYTPPISRASNPIVSDNRFHCSPRTSGEPPRGAELGLLSLLEFFVVTFANHSRGAPLTSMDGGLTLMGLDGNEASVQITSYDRNSGVREARQRVSRTSSALNPEQSFYSFLTGGSYRYLEGSSRGSFPYAVDDYQLQQEGHDTPNDDPRLTETSRQLLKQPPALVTCKLTRDANSVDREDAVLLDASQIAAPVYIAPAISVIQQSDPGRHESLGDQLDDILNYRVENVVTLPVPAKPEPSAAAAASAASSATAVHEDQHQDAGKHVEARHQEDDMFPMQMDVDDEYERDTRRSPQRTEAVLAKPVDPMSLMLEVRGLPRGTVKQDAILKHFSSFNVVTCWDIRGTWLLQFPSVSDKDSARRSLDGSKIAYRKIRLVRATQRPPSSSSSSSQSSSSLFSAHSREWNERDVGHEARALLRDQVARQVVKRMMQGKGMQVLKEKVRAWERGCAEAAAVLANSVVKRETGQHVDAADVADIAGEGAMEGAGVGGDFAALGSFKKLQHLKAKAAELKRRQKQPKSKKRKAKSDMFDEDEEDELLEDLDQDLHEEKRVRVYQQPWGLDLDEEGDPTELRPSSISSTTIDEGALDWEDRQRLKRWRLENGLPEHPESILMNTRSHASGSVRFWPVPAVKNAPKVHQYAHLLAKHTQRPESAPGDAAQTVGSRRSRRADQRSMQLAMSDLDGNILQGREKKLKFQRSGIHAWGLFAQEPIKPREFIIEYIGEVVRERVADKRETGYEKLGIGSSYMFRIDADTVVDATERGNVARFTNHSCDPNCYAQVIKVKGEPKIVFYALRSIAVGEEITYDYCFASEIEKIPCHCGAATCKGSLN